MRPIETTDLIDLQIWCRDYHRNTKYPSGLERRFAIGFYQIYQGMEWKNSASADESWAAAACHFLMVGEHLNLGIEQHLPRDIITWSKTSFTDALLHDLSLAQQHIVYATNPSKIKRKSRYNPEILEKTLANVIGMCLGGRIRPNNRSKAIYDATSIMAGVL